MRGLKLTAVLAVLLTSCVTAKVITPSAGPIDFKQYKTVRLIVLDSVMTPYSREGIPLFEGWLKDMLQSQGYSIVEKEEDLRIEVTVTEFRPGRKFLGIWYLWSYGYGRNLPALTYVASFKDRLGVITELEGGKSYHGFELTENPDYMTEEQIRMRLIRHSAIQIAQFIQNNGSLE